MAELPSGTLTFLFTDLEGSTRLWETHLDEMREALQQHDAIVREAVVTHGGVVVKTTGDGFHAVFTTADGALLAAIAAQRQLADADWGATGPLRVRMGLHTGVASYRDGDYYGPSLNRAARLMSVAHGGQVICSHTTADLARDALGTDVELLDLGDHRLRDLSRAERVYQVAAPGLARDFAHLRSLDSFPGNLPVQVTSFVGRDDDLLHLRDRFHDARLMTLTGVGGVGKTRLAIHAAAELVPTFPDGAWFCELAAASEPEAVVQVVAATLGVQPHPEVPLDARLSEWLRDRSLLLVLDNCEHVLDAVSRLAETVLRACPSVRILATSREPLEIDGEHVMRVRSLTVPDADADGADREETDAMRLFIERAHSAEPEFPVGDRDRAAIGDICRRLDGIPLAIELAAARVVSMSPAEILALLDERFRLLTGGRRTAVERHQTLRATVDWSYSLLTPGERTMFDRLGVFPSTFDADAAQAIVGEGIESWQIIDTLTGLVNKSMVTTAAVPDGARRYQLLETLRQYARERLDQAGDADRCRRAHAEYYAEFAELVSQAFATGIETDRWWTQLQLEVDNLRAATTWALDSGAPDDVEIALRIAALLAGAAPGQRRAAGLMTLSHRLLERAGSSRPDLRAGVLAGMANDALFMNGDIVLAQRLARESIAAGPNRGGAVAIAYTTLGLCATFEGRHEDAVEVIREGYRAMRALGVETAHNDSFFESLLASTTSYGGDVVAAREHASEAVRFARQSDLPMRMAAALTTYARIWHEEDPDAANRALDEVDQLGRDRVGRWFTGWTAALRAEFAVAAGDDRTALEFVVTALALLGDDSTALTAARFASIGTVVVAAVGEPLHAAVLSGAASDGVHAQMMRYTLDPRVRTRVEETAAGLRSQLGEAEWVKAGAVGATMTSDELLRYLRRVVGEALAALPD